MASVIMDIKQTVVKGGPEAEVEGLTRRAVADGYDVNEILNGGLIAGIEAIGEMWEKDEAFIPDILFAAKAMHAGMGVIRQQLTKGASQRLGRVVIGTVKGDVHDIGKSLVGVMLEAFGFEVYDLGVDVAPEKFVETAKARAAQMVCMSALLTTTMPQMESTLKALKGAGLKVVTMVGGAPVTQEYADSIGASGYAPDAFSAVSKAKRLLRITSQ